MRWNTAKGQLPRPKQRYPRRQRGAAIAEFVVVLPALLVLGLGSLQSALFYQAKTTVTYAAFEAARKGATLHGQKTPMLDEFGLRLAPVFGGDGSGSNALHAINKGQLEARDPRITGIDIINPTHEAFLEFGTDNPETGKIEIPNSHLQYRDATRIGASSGVNVQDANLLKIKITYGFALTVPLVNGLVTSALKRIDPQNAAFYDQNRIPISAVATVRMQSEAWEDGNLSASGTPPGGGVVPNGEPGAAGTDDTETDDPTAGQGDPLNPVDPFQSNSNQCDSSVQSCLDNPANQGNPNSCSAAGNSAASTQTAKVTGLPATGTGNPIHVVSGNKYQVETDFAALPGPLGLVWQRHYNSQSRYRGGLGTGWRHSYDVQVRRTTDGMRLIQSDGRHLLFKDAGAGRYQSTLASDGWLTVAQNNHKGGDERITWHWRSGQQLQFNAGGQLTDITLPSGAAVRLQYNDEQRLFLVRDAQNRELSLGYYPNGRLRSVLDTTGQRLRYTYDDRGNLAAVTYADTTTRHYHYADKHDRNNLTGITDQRGVRFATWTYDEHDRAISSEHAGGVEKVSVQFNDDGTRLVTNSLGEISSYYTEVKQGLGVVTRIDGPGCSICGPGEVEYDYNNALALIKTSYKDGRTTHREYDTQDRLTALYEQIDDQPKRLVSRFGFDGGELLPSTFSRPSINPTGYHSKVLTRDSDGQIIDITEIGYAPDYQGGFNKMTRSTRYEYKNGELYASDGPAPGTADRVVYPASRQKPAHPAAAKAASPKRHRVKMHGREYELVYNKKGQLLSLQNEQNQSVADLRYNELGNLISLSGAKGTATAEYDAAGRIIAATGPQGRQQNWEWDTEGRLLRQASLNEAGELTTEQNYSYNALNQLARVTLMNGEEEYFEYGLQSELTSRTDSQGRRTEFGYDSDGLLASATRLANTADAVTERAKYDVHGNVIERTDARGNTSYWAYDDFGHLLFKSNPDSGVTMYRYDAAGQVIARVNESGVIARFKYNDQGQLIGIAPVDQPATTTFAFTADGAPKKMQDLNQTTEYTYADGRVAEKRITLKTLNQHYVTKYFYDTEGNISSVQIPGGQSLLFARGRDDKTTVIKHEGRVFDNDLLSLALNDNGSLAAVHYGNNQTTTYSYHPNGTLATLDVSASAATVREQRYRYTRDLQVSEIQMTSPTGSQTHTYNYDAQGRLIAAKQYGERYRWAFDQVGNRVKQQHNGTTDSYRYAESSNRMLSRNNELIRYLPTGEIRASGSLRYQYTAGHRLSKVYQGNTLLAQYRYNADGERIEKIDSTRTPAQHSYYLYENKKLVAELDGAGKIKRQYVYAGRRLLGLFDGKQFYAIHTNHLGAPEIVTNKRGEIIWQASYSPYGEATIHKEKIVLNIRLPGQYFDRETGHHYNIFRNYNPATGRYLTSDPLGIAAGFNTYVYVKNDPLNRIDPLGLYDEYVHYYMTYFLAVTAGLSEDEAEIVARATQYVDDNPITNPIPSKREALEALARPTLVGRISGIGQEVKETYDALRNYHFTLDYDDETKTDGDAPHRGNETYEDYVRRRVENPDSAQLQRLRNAALSFDNTCHAGLPRYREPNEPTEAEIKAQLYGEYLHAFEDTFAHRDNTNNPLSILNSTGLLGHGLLFHRPDHTYNQFYTLSNTQGYWRYNELRTLQMEQEVFTKLVADFGTMPVVTWEELAGDGSAKIGTDGTNGFVRSFYTPAEGITRVLQEFNAYNPESHPDGASTGEKAKIIILNAFLTDNGLGEIPPYDKDNSTKAAANRARILGGLPPINGVISEPKG